MHERERRLQIRIEQIGVHRRDLVGDQHALVDERVRREAGDVEELPLRQLEGVDRDLDPFADDVELPLEPRVRRDARADPGLAADEDLPEDGFHRDGRRPQQAVVGRDVAPAEHPLAFLEDDLLEQGLDRLALEGVARQEDHAGAVLLRGREVDAELRGVLAEELVGHLDEDAGAVARVDLAAAGPAVEQVDEHLEGLADDRVRARPLDVDDEADAARVVLVSGVVEPLGLRSSWLVRHRRVLRALRRASFCPSSSSGFHSPRE